ncbi:hypothetical protein TNCV_845641 [Trichonephila clavipes]|nr:hypothetical protein TNCV_845641 [Trichonephila clavipes]
MSGICLAYELPPVNPPPPVYWNFGEHCLMSVVIFPKRNSDWIVPQHVPRNSPLRHFMTSLDTRVSTCENTMEDSNMQNYFDTAVLNRGDRLGQDSMRIFLSEVHPSQRGGFI